MNHGLPGWEDLRHSGLLRDAARLDALSQDLPVPLDVACRVAMRPVVVLFAEARELLPRENALYHEGHGLAGLLNGYRWTSLTAPPWTKDYSAWPRVLALVRQLGRSTDESWRECHLHSRNLLTEAYPSVSVNQFRFHRTGDL